MKTDTPPFCGSRGPVVKRGLYEMVNMPGRQTDIDMRRAEQPARSERRPMSRQTFVRNLAVKMLACEGITAIWQLNVAAADAHRVGRSGVAAMLIEIADAAEWEWVATATGEAKLAAGLTVAMPAASRP
jgi:hypothetical protein